MLSGVIPATHKAVQRAGINVKDIGLFEVNEAFASVAAAWRKDVEADWAKTNIRGGAIALGHPFGMTGARIMTTLLNSLEDAGARFGLESMCVGGGQGMAMIVERLD
jgi:acetyl-CoA acyltransferase